ncbi:MAG: DUF2723 domain-containing protein [candidate division Zixibacteria bacterium]|nr:DUF2723 domain-containing protein [candidate division Zixibacteria bacterium]
MDSAAFATCNEILGLPHSPSFPLYTILGRVFHLFFDNPAQASNVYSAVSSAAGGVVFFLILRLLLTRLSKLKKYIGITAVCGTFFAFMSLPVWQSSVRAEVYALQILLALLTLYFFTRALLDRDNRNWQMFIFLTIFFQGLSFTNHSLLAIITLPVIPILIWMTYRQTPVQSFMRIAAVAVILFAISISVYLYLPIRSNQDPAINSGQPKTMETAYNAITRSGEDFLPEGAVPPADYLARATKLMQFLFYQTGGFIIIGLILAIAATIKKKRLLAACFGLMASLGFLITIWAADFRTVNFDIVAYAGLPLILTIMLSFTGLYTLVEKYQGKTAVKFLPMIFILMAFFEFYGNLYDADLTDTEGPDILAEAVFQFAPKDALLIVNEDDVALPLWYHCFAAHRRPDVAVISAGALYRPAYRNQVQQLYPELHFPEGIDEYKINNLDNLVAQICSLNYDARPIQVQFGTPGVVTDNLSPDGFLFRYSAEKIVNPLPSGGTSRILKLIAGNATDLLTIEFTARNAFNYGVYFDKIGQSKDALEFFQYAIETDAENPEYLLRLGIAFLNAGRSQDAVELLKQAVVTGDGCPEAEKILNSIEARKLS